MFWIKKKNNIIRRAEKLICLSHISFIIKRTLAKKLNCFFCFIRSAIHSDLLVHVISVVIKCQKTQLNTFSNTSPLELHGSLYTERAVKKYKFQKHSLLKKKWEGGKTLALTCQQNMTSFVRRGQGSSGSQSGPAIASPGTRHSALPVTAFTAPSRVTHRPARHEAESLQESASAMREKWVTHFYETRPLASTGM